MDARKYRLELCCDNIETALLQWQKVDQIEYCADLANDGLTPSLHEVASLLKSINTPIKVMIRCRPGDFQYTKEELKIMVNSARAFVDIGIDRFVFGALKNGKLDLEAIEDFCHKVFPAKVCVHKAIDLSEAILEDLLMLLKIENVNEVLTSGGKITAQEGVETIKQMIEIAKKQLDILPAGKITHHNLDNIHASIGAKIYHGRQIVI